MKTVRYCLQLLLLLAVCILIASAENASAYDDGSSYEGKVEDYMVPKFTKTSKMKTVKTFYVNGVWYAGVKLKTGKYSLYVYDLNEFKRIVSSSRVDFTRCFNLNDTPCFLRWNKSGYSILYRLENNELVKAGKYKYSALFDEEYCECYDIYVEDDYLVVNSMDEYSDNVYIFDEYFSLMYSKSFYIEDYYYTLSIKDGVLSVYCSDPDEETWTTVNLRKKSIKKNGKKRYLLDSYLGGVIDYSRSDYTAIYPYVGKWYNEDAVEDGVAGYYIYSDGFVSIVEASGAVTPIVESCYVNSKGKLFVYDKTYSIKDGVLTASDGTPYYKVNSGYPDWQISMEFVGDWRYLDEDFEPTEEGVIIYPDGYYVYTDSETSNEGSTKSISSDCIALLDYETLEPVFYIWVYGDTIDISDELTGDEYRTMYYVGYAQDQKAG